MEEGVGANPFAICGMFSQTGEAWKVGFTIINKFQSFQNAPDSVPSLTLDSDKPGYPPDGSYLSRPTPAAEGWELITK